jgi:pSer/pThr/pTyr-binding forkhead associated (FHA) protein
MALITLRVLDGPDRGRAFEDLLTPVSIGREEGNAVQLNDERVSRFHLKIQEDEDRLVVTDLESTNGTRLNGETIQLGMLRPGDVLQVGRSLLVYGSRHEIATRLAAMRGADLDAGVVVDPDELDQVGSSVLLAFELGWAKDPKERFDLHTLLPPSLPTHLSPGQAAQLTELLQFLHLRMRALTQTVKMKGRGDRVTLEQRQWQAVVDLEARLAQYLRAVGEPEF